MSFSKKYFFSLAMSSPGGPDMVNGLILPKKTLQHSNSCIANFGRETKNSAN